MVIGWIIKEQNHWIFLPECVCVCVCWKRIEGKLNHSHAATQSPQYVEKWKTICRLFPSLLCLDFNYAASLRGEMELLIFENDKYWVNVYWINTLKGKRTQFLWHESLSVCVEKLLLCDIKQWKRLMFLKCQAFTIPTVNWDRCTQRQLLCKWSKSLWAPDVNPAALNTHTHTHFHTAVDDIVNVHDYI